MNYIYIVSKYRSIDNIITQYDDRACGPLTDDDRRGNEEDVTRARARYTVWASAPNVS